MWLTGLVEVVPSRDGDLEPKKAGRPSDDTATHNTTEHNHPITIPVFVEFVKAACTRLFRRSKGATRKFKRDQGGIERRRYPKLQEHLGAAAAFMKIRKNHLDFVDMMDQHYPRFGEQYRLPFPYEPDQDDGKGM
jgi:hypothetical protein